TGSVGASLTTPTSISGATSPAARAMARIIPVIMAGVASGITTFHNVSALVAPRASEPCRIVLGIRDNPSSVETITTGKVSSASVSEAQIKPGVPNVGTGNDSGKNKRSMLPPT